MLGRFEIWQLRNFSHERRNKQDILPPGSTWRKTGWAWIGYKLLYEQSRFLLGKS